MDRHTNSHRAAHSKDRWARVAQDALRLDPSALTALRPDPGGMRRRLAPGNAPSKTAPPPPAPFALPHPLHCEWSWRPAPWAAAIAPSSRDAAATGTAIGPGVTLHHDSPTGHAGFAQTPQPDGPAPFAFQLMASNLRGSFLSLAIDLPAAARDGLQRRHLIGLHLALNAAPPAQVFARLNIRHGPNTALIQQEIPQALITRGGGFFEFDLACITFDEARTGHIWCDLILGAPFPETIILRDVAFTRRPRAAI